jgi:hypothetical protein
LYKGILEHALHGVFVFVAAPVLSLTNAFEAEMCRRFSAARESQESAQTKNRSEAVMSRDAFLARHSLDEGGLQL